MSMTPTRRILVLNFCALASLVMGACTMPFIDKAKLSQAKDTVVPAITIISPSDGYQCANIVEVKGTVNDTVNDSSPGGITTLKYAIAGSTVQGTIVPLADGSFSFQFKTDNLVESFTLTVTAVDWNGNESSKSVLLRKVTGNSIPSFSGVVSDKAVSLSWETVPNTVKYTLQYTSDGSLPTDGIGTTVDNVSSPFTLICTNGSMYTFRLKAVATSGWVDSSSNFIKYIPIGPGTLVPTVTSGRSSVTLNWKSIAATNDFQIWRRVGTSGDFNLFRQINDTTFTDSNVVDGQYYYYCIKPSANCSVLSLPGVGQTDGFAISPVLSVPSAIHIAARSFALSGTTMYGVGSGGLEIYDVSHPATPVWVGKKTWNTVYDIAVAGNFVYLAAGSDGLVIYDITNPQAPVFISATQPGAIIAKGIAVSGNKVWVVNCLDSTNPSNLIRFNVATPASPLLESVDPLNVNDAGTASATGSSPWDYGPTRAIVSGNYVCIAARYSGLQIVSTTANYSTKPAKTITAAGNAVWGISQKGNYIYMVSGSDGLRVIDPGNSFNLFAGPLLASGSSIFNDICVDGAYAYVANTYKGLQILNLDTATAPELSSNILFPVTFDGSGPRQVAVHNGFAYVTSENSYTMQAVDLNTPLLKKVATIPNSGIGGGAPVKMAIAGPIACVATGNIDEGLQIVDISNPAAPQKIGSVNTSGGFVDAFTNPTTGVAIFGNYAYVTALYTGLKVVDISSPTTPKLVAQTDFGDESLLFQTIAVSKGYAYVVTRYSQLWVVDINNPLTPKKVLSLGIPFFVKDIYISGNYAFLSDYSGASVCIINISEPLKAFVARSIAIAVPAYLQSITVANQRICSLHDTNGYHIFDLADPASSTPSLVADVTVTTSSAQTMVSSGNFVYGSRWDNPGSVSHLEAWDISKAGTPRLISAVDTAKCGSSNGMAMIIDGPWLYTASSENGLECYALRP